MGLLAGMGQEPRGIELLDRHAAAAIGKKIHFLTSGRGFWQKQSAWRKNQAPHRLWSARRQIDAFFPKKPQRGSIEFGYDLRVRSAASLAAMHVAVAPDPAMTVTVVVHLGKAATVLGDAGRQGSNRRSL
jgi:hypothetical protein